MILKKNRAGFLTFLEGWEHRGVMFCDCEGTFIENIAEIKDWEEDHEYDPEMLRWRKSGPRPVERRCEGNHWCHACGSDLINVGFQIHVRWTQLNSEPKDRYHNNMEFYCDTTCLSEFYPDKWPLVVMKSRMAKDFLDIEQRKRRRQGGKPPSTNIKF